jgi:hypothetical protein
MAFVAAMCMLERSFTKRYRGANAEAVVASSSVLVLAHSHTSSFACTEPILDGCYRLPILLLLIPKTKYHFTRIIPRHFASFNSSHSHQKRHLSSVRRIFFVQVPMSSSMSPTSPTCATVIKPMLITTLTPLAQHHH